MKFLIISGGQTGADLGGLIAGYKLKFETSGYAPKGYKTEKGEMPLLKKFGLIEMSSNRYDARTLQNVLSSTVTIIFSDVKSTGSDLTKKYCEEFKKPFYETSTFTCDIKDLRKWLIKISKLEYVQYDKKIIINIAGNRESKSPGIQKRVEEILVNLFSNK